MSKLSCVIVFMCLLFTGFGCTSSANSKQKSMQMGDGLVIDVRTKGEYDDGHLPRSINIPYDIIKKEIGSYAKDKEQKIYVYCRSGRRSGIAQNLLRIDGYKNVVNAGAYKKLLQGIQVEE
ncbi:MAG: rhodanese-like domain-containing protein [Desulfotalea sp.]